MAKKTCPKGHIYDVGIYGDDCPFCTPQNSGGGKTIISGINDGGDDAGAKTIISGTVQGTPKFCPQCGTSLTEGIKFCPSCGSAIVHGTNGGTMVPGTEGSGFSGETQISTGAKTVIYGHAPESEPQMSTTTPSVPVASVPPVAESAPATQVAWPPTVPLSPATVLAGVAATVQQTATGKKKRLWEIVAAAVGMAIGMAIGLGVFFLVVYRPVKLNDNDQIIFTQQKNNDELVKGNLSLTLKDVKATQKFIAKIFPDFDFEEEGYVTDDYRNELLIKEFNSNPGVMSIYLGGVPKMAGFSSTYAGLLTLDLDDDGNDELLGYYFSADQEFSDTSGIEYFSGRYPSTYQVDNEVDSIGVHKYLYADTNEPYWVIEWDDDISAKDRLALLKAFLNRLRYKKVFQNLGPDFFKDIYTGIEQHQTIEDIVDWWE